MAQAWNERLQSELNQLVSKKSAAALHEKYASAFPNDYKDDYTPRQAAHDIEHLEKLNESTLLALSFYISQLKQSAGIHIRLFQFNKLLALSDVLPMLENFGLRTENEHPYQIILKNNQSLWISDFVVSTTHASPTDHVIHLFQEAFLQVNAGIAENDGFNHLVLSAALSWQQITILRMYAKYLRQTGFRFSQPYIEKALINNPAITTNLVNLFETLHNPKNGKQAVTQAGKIEKTILKSLGSVSSLDEDKIIRRMLDLIKYTLRTNYFQRDANNKPKNYLSVKLHSRKLPDMPQPVPLYEVFVYSTDFEAIHLRNAQIARGGLRWSDRPEDFRTEVLGLMKAQVVKNAVIVPSGAKGGFVIKNPTSDAITCYKSFLRGLLDITDNIKNKRFIPPVNVICYDDIDPYLVVAADKGTASFSDIANSVSAEYEFWLGDAFASGGSNGYDHKKMGITARGAWESIKRHFRELNIDPLKTDITVIGIGDMSGDVFGNGMLYSKHIRLVGAFDHRHIFIDPEPDATISYYERTRLFDLPRSSWADYNAKLISKGGGIFSRSLKSITLTPQMKKIFATEENELTPNELIRTMLKAPIDLLFNGGIGTYVKAANESNADVGDRTNEYCRINGNELRCKIVGEGGNLGFTQLGRVEFALNGGLINTDFIDNSAGVDCSDHEVNLKILLDQQVQSGKMSIKDRNKLLISLTDEVAEIVLRDNFYQALVMSFSAYHAPKNIGLHMNYIQELENQQIINRSIEFLPSAKELAERKASGHGLTRPELAVLLAYTKIAIKKEILKSDLTDDPYLKELQETAFPPAVRKKYKSIMNDHRLAKDIVATQISNRIINEMGITFVYRLQMETGATTTEIIKAHTIASQIFNKSELQKVILSLDFKISMPDQYNMLFHIRNLINLATRWFLHGKHLQNDLRSTIEHYRTRVQKLEKMVPSLMSGLTSTFMKKLIADFVQTGISEEIAMRIATYRAIYTALNIIEVATKHNFDLEKTAKVYFHAGERINLVWYRDQINTDSREGHWNTLARLALRDELDISQRTLTLAIMKCDAKEKDPIKLIDLWMDKNQRSMERWNRITTMLTTSTNLEYTMFFIAIRELVGLIVATIDSSHTVF